MVGRNDGDIARDVAQVLVNFMKVSVAVAWWNQSSQMHSGRTCLTV